MDIEFHYYMTHLIAVKAGFTPDEANIIAHTSQYVDDNDVIVEINKGEKGSYCNYISQTMDILKPKDDLFRIYPLFHFIPGEPDSKSAIRKDGSMHWLNTTPNSKNANDIIDAALATGDLHRIGVASHSYVDTWAHQNFIGYYDHFNAMRGPLATLAPDIGHADARHAPDVPDLIWDDVRLMNPTVDNRQRFLEAAAHLLEKLAHQSDRALPDTELDQRRRQLLDDLGTAIGEAGGDSTPDERIARYRALSATGAYGDWEIPDYDEHRWFDDAVNEDVRGLLKLSHPLLSHLDPWPTKFTWKAPDEYQDTHWWKFQEAVKAHQNTAWDILAATNLKHVDLPRL